MKSKRINVKKMKRKINVRRSMTPLTFNDLLEAEQSLETDLLLFGGG